MSALQIGCCISSHGFGHAARAMAVMEALLSLVDIELTIVTLVPEWFLRSSYSGPFTLFPIQTDVGLVQQTPLEEDIPASLAALSSYYPVHSQTVRSFASIFSSCSMVLCDISPAGILGARKAEVPSVLLENFTWDWMYEGYQASYPGFQPFIQYLRQINTQADFRVQTVPVCNAAPADLIVPPVARAVREDRGQLRCRLRVEEDERLVLLSMGGIRIAQQTLDRLQEVRSTVFVISGYTGEMLSAANLKFLPPDTDFFHPDLVAASDVVIGKLGYSTLAEVYHADVPFGYVSRPGFRESGPLDLFIREEMSGLEIDRQDFLQGQWVKKLEPLLHFQKKGIPRQNGAIRCAQFLLSLLDR